MRVVAGTARGLRLDAPPGTSTRPTTDRVREAVFNALGSLGVLEGAEVVDLFAGSGAMGIEALSRGAATATFVESDRGAAKVVQANIDRCRFVERSTVVTTPVDRFLQRGRPFDLAIIDPPYSFDEWPALIASLDATTVVVESNRSVDLGDQWIVLRNRTYGSTVVQIAARRTGESPTNPQES